MMIVQYISINISIEYNNNNIIITNELINK